MSECKRLMIYRDSGGEQVITRSRGGRASDTSVAQAERIRLTDTTEILCKGIKGLRTKCF